MTGTRNDDGHSAERAAPAKGHELHLHPSMPGYAQTHYAQNHALQSKLKEFWNEMMEDVQETNTDPSTFKNQQLPLARIKKIMKSDEDVRMISAEAPVLFAKACEFFILEMTHRAWDVAQECQRRTLQRSDIAVAIARTHIWDFLLDTVPLQEAIEATAIEGEEAPPADDSVAAVDDASEKQNDGARPPVAEDANAHSMPDTAQMPPQMPPGMFPPGQFMPPPQMGAFPQMMPPPPGMLFPIPPGMYPPGMQAPFPNLENQANVQPNEIHKRPDMDEDRKRKRGSATSSKRNHGDKSN